MAAGVGDETFEAPGANLFGDWYRAPLGDFAGVPGYHVRRATPDDFEAIWDLVDDAFGVRRSRTLYEWLYRKNPCGPARCFNVIEDATGELVATGAHCPWPGAVGDRRVPAQVNGDSAVRRSARGRGIDKMRLDAWRRHPLRSRVVTVGWPNETSLRHTRQRGLHGMLAGPLRRVVLRLDSRPPGASLLERSMDKLRGLARGSGSGLRVERVTRFDERFEPLAARFMRSEGVWFPRNAEFLDWRYLAHPVREYLAFALLRRDELLGFCVLNLDGSRATLMELAAPHGSEETTFLLGRASEVVRQAGCGRVEFFASSGFGQWASLDAAGFVPRKSERMLFLNRFGSPDSAAENWSVTPAENEVL